ncbi:hypothetical protein MHU86_15435 [Fragilaria crotonensis]|nr:hypothetical protein MHU86_15435 [Fragilaria crotonensis]
MISNFFVISPRGDTIIAKDYRSDRGDVGAHERSHTEAFFRKIKFYGGVDGDDLHPKEKEEGKRKANAPPVFIMPDGLSYFHVQRNGLIFGCSTARNVSPTTVVQLLSTIAKVFKDYCGTLSEEAIRKNFILLYELLDEMMDFGYPQVTETENLKAFIYNEPIVIETVTNTGNLVNPKTASANAVHKPVISSVNANGRKNNLNSNQKNEIFVDILEKLNIVFSNNGGQYGSVTVDDIIFNNCVNLIEFDSARTISFVPPDGEFVVLNYRMTGEFKVPFRIFPAIEEVAPDKLELSVMIRAEIPNNHFGANVTVEIPIPRCTAAASCNVIASPGSSPNSAEWVQKDSKIVWSIKKFPGLTEQTLKAKITLSSACTTQIRREIGPINMGFEIPMYNVSNLQVRYLRIAENMPGYTPYRWVRYVTQSNSYVCRL